MGEICDPTVGCGFGPLVATLATTPVGKVTEYGGHYCTQDPAVAADKYSCQRKFRAKLFGSSVHEVVKEGWIPTSLAFVHL